jgi:hypothetical protein
VVGDLLIQTEATLLLAVLQQLVVVERQQQEALVVVVMVYTDQSTQERVQSLSLVVQEPLDKALLAAEVTAFPIVMPHLVVVVALVLLVILVAQALVALVVLVQTPIQVGQQQQALV